MELQGKTNTVSIVVADRPKPGTITNILVAVLAAVLFGLLGRFLPDEMCKNIIDIILSPIADSFLGLMTTFSGLMIVFTICSGMLGIGDSATMEKTGRKVVSGLIVLSFALCIVTVVMLVPFLKMNNSSQGHGEASGLIEISKLFFDILPSNIIDPERLLLHQVTVPAFLCS